LKGISAKLDNFSKFSNLGMLQDLRSYPVIRRSSTFCEKMEENAKAMNLVITQ